MITIGQGKVRQCSGVTRRDFLRAGGVGLGSMGFSLAELERGNRRTPGQTARSS